MSSEDVIEVQNLNVYFKDKHVLKDISFSCRKGEILGMMGLSGAGKSTLVRVLTCQLRHAKGEVKVGGHDPRKNPEKVLQLIGYVPQLEEVNLYYEFSAIQNVLIFADLYGIARDEALKLTKKYFQILEIPEDVWNKKVKRLSGGEKKRVSITMGLINSPEILFLDEPTTGVDSSKRFDMINYLKKLNTETGTTMIIVTHDLETANICDRTMILVDGKIIDFDHPDKLIQKLPSNGKILRITVPHLNDQIIKKIDQVPEVFFHMRKGKEVLELYMDDINKNSAKLIKFLNDNHISIQKITRDRAKFKEYFQLRIENPIHAIDGDSALIQSDRQFSEIRKKGGKIS
ncbi:MAG: ABC transporter ATP-binding protein [Candidatus Helarchaeota archaeon]